MKSKKITVIVPVYKAEKFIKKNLEELKYFLMDNFKNWEIVAVVDGSPDKSRSECEKVKGVRVVGYKINRGKGNALKYGFKHSTGDYITFLDCDFDLPPEQIVNFYPYLATADMVVGSKRHPFSLVKYPLKRRILSKIFQVYSKIFLFTSLRDTQTGLKMFKRELLDVILPLVVMKKHVFDLELCFLARKHGFRYVEAPIHLKYNDFDSSIGVESGLGALLDVLAIRYRYSFMKYYQKEYHKSRFKK